MSMLIHKNKNDRGSLRRQSYWKIELDLGTTAIMLHVAISVVLTDFLYLTKTTISCVLMKIKLKPPCHFTYLDSLLFSLEQYFKLKIPHFKEKTISVFQIHIALCTFSTLVCRDQV